MDSDAPAGATVLIQLNADPARLTGSVRVNDGPQRRFDGWLELMRELEEAQGLPRSGTPTE